MIINTGAATNSASIMNVLFMAYNLYKLQIALITYTKNYSYLKYTAIQQPMDFFNQAMNKMNKQRTIQYPKRELLYTQKEVKSTIAT